MWNGFCYKNYINVNPKFVRNYSYVNTKIACFISTKRILKEKSLYLFVVYNSYPLFVSTCVRKTSYKNIFPNQTQIIQNEIIKMLFMLMINIFLNVFLLMYICSNKKQKSKHYITYSFFSVIFWCILAVNKAFQNNPSTHIYICKNDLRSFIVYMSFCITSSVPNRRITHSIS